jgi:hypothetical protein
MRRWYELGRWERHLLAALAFALGVLVSTNAAAAPDWDDDQWRLDDIIHQMARVYDLDPNALVRTAVCESQMGYFRYGDRGHSHGPWQLNDRATGLLPHFYEVGYTDPYDYNQSTDYVARVASGEWAGRGITMQRWSCWREAR